MESLPPNTTLSHYRIVSKIGGGGMGEVYLAQDTSELGRTVALKILPAELAQNKDRLQRFTHEARTVSNLNHPNILTVYEFGQTKSTSFMATEYVDGVTLRQYFSNRRLKFVDVLDVTIQIVAALNAAHEAGVTHRDLKPENVMIRKDHIVKVLDFGLAKLSEPGAAATGSTPNEDATRLQVNTTPGVVMGTVSYMSPEQSVGNGVDHRTDIWSAGVVLYEMLAGVVPFPGKDIHRQIIAIQETEPAPISQNVDDVPERLEEIVAKCLAKDKNERYQTAKDLLIDLRNLRRKLDVDAEIERTVAPTQRSTSGAAKSGTTAAEAGGTNVSGTRTTSSAEYVVSGLKRHKVAAAVVLLALVAGLVSFGLYMRSRNVNAAGNINSIAVMPFVNEGGNADVEYLSDGMTETLISSLSQIPNLNVKARSLVFRYKGKEVNPQNIGKELDVQAILNGRVVQRGTDLILYLELVDAQTGNLIWGDQYNRKQTDLVSLQGEIARDVSSKLKTKLSGADEQKLTKTYTENSEAYKLYLQGRYFANKRTPKDIQKAIECFQHAADMDPNYGPAYAGLAIGYTYLTIYSDTPAKEAFPKAKEFALKALAIDSNLAEPHISLGLLGFLQDHDFATWEREAKRSLELNPNSTDTHRLNGFRLLYLGKFDEAMIEIKRAIEIDPLSTPAHINLAFVLFYSGRIDEAETQTTATIDLAPEFWFGRFFAFSLYRLKKDYARAVEELALSKEFRGETEAAKLIRDSFSKGGWQGLLQTIVAEHARLKISPYNLATIYAELGDKDQAFAALNQAIDDSDQYIGFMKIDPFMNHLRSDPRFQEVLKRAGFPK